MLVWYKKFPQLCEKYIKSDFPFPTYLWDQIIFIYFHQNKLKQWIER